MFNDENHKNGGRPFFAFGEMAGFRIVPFIAMHVKMIFCCFFFFFLYGAMKKKKKKKKSQPIRTCQPAFSIY